MGWKMRVGRRRGFCHRVDRTAEAKDLIVPRNFWVSWACWTEEIVCLILMY